MREADISKRYWMHNLFGPRPLPRKSSPVRSENRSVLQLMFGLLHFGTFCKTK